MHLKLTILAFLITFSFDVSYSRSPRSTNYEPQGQVSRKIIVDKSGRGDFVTVQQAIDSVAPNNKEWVATMLKAGTYKYGFFGIYTEKVLVPKNKPFIVLEGQGRGKTLIQYGDYGSSLESTTFTVLADQFVARNVTFKNTYARIIPRVEGVPLTWAPAFRITGDKCAFYQCGFIGLQDTLTDQLGRHYYESCYIEGIIDFIWGFGHSFFQNCHIRVTAEFEEKATGYITAHARLSSERAGGFVFNSGSVDGGGKAYLGRAYDRYSRVLFHGTCMSNVVAPEGWDIWRQKGNESTITYAESGCSGPGSNMSKRVSWEKKLPNQEWSKFKDVKTFINQDGWIQKQPKYPI